MYSKESLIIIFILVNLEYVSKYVDRFELSLNIFLLGYLLPLMQFLI